MRLKDIYETISPIVIKPHTDHLHISLSKRFIMFQVMNKLVKTIEEDPYFNFIAVLKSYKILGRILSGTVHEFYRDRNRLYFKNFFFDRVISPATSSIKATEPSPKIVAPDTPSTFL